MKKLLLTSALAFVVNMNISNAIVTEAKTINNINDIVLSVQEHVPLNADNKVTEETVAIFDWDRVIVKGIVL